MATAQAMIERRRSSRVLIRIPVKIFSNGTLGQPLDTPAEAIAVSRCGALLRSPYSPALGSQIEVLNGLSQETREFRVIRIGQPKSGRRPLRTRRRNPVPAAQFLGHPVPRRIPGRLTLSFP